MPELPTRRSPLANFTGWGFLICAAVAVGYGLWALYGSGSRLTTVDAINHDAPSAPTSTPPSATSPPANNAESPTNWIGPIHLDPAMSPMRAVLHVAYAPVGSIRPRYEVELVDAAGRSCWKKQGSPGSHDDDASIVKVTTSLALFDLEQSGDYWLRVQMVNRGMDHLREATLELRRNVARVNPRITWGSGLAALGCLIVNLVASRRQPWPYRPKEDSEQMAA